MSRRCTSACVAANAYAGGMGMAELDAGARTPAMPMGLTADQQFLTRSLLSGPGQHPMTQRPSPGPFIRP
jgi:hypothetical protein